MAETKPNICTLCSLGCGLLIESDEGDPIALEYRMDYPVNEGALCAKGNYALELLNHPLRLAEPMRKGAAIGWEAAAAEMARALGSSSAALIVEGDMSDEEASLLAAFASACMALERVAVSFPTGDDAVIRALGELPVQAAGIEDLKSSACTIAVNDPFSVGPVVARWVLQARNAARRNTLNVIAPSENVVSRFAAAKLIGPVRAGLLSLLKGLIQCRGDSAPAWAKAVTAKLSDLAPGGNDAAAASLAEEFAEAASGVILLSTPDPVAARLAACCSLVAGESKKLFPLNDYGNAAGVCRRIAGAASVETILDEIGRGSVDTLVVLGSDLVSSYPHADAEARLRSLKTLIAGAPFANKTTKLAGLVLPIAVWLEKEGTFNGAAQKAVAMPAGAALSYGDILGMVGQAMSVRLGPQTAATQEPFGLNAEFVAQLVSEAAEPEAEPAVVSTTTKFADGSLTDILTWPQALAAEPTSPSEAKA